MPKAGEVVYEVKDEKKAKFILNKKKEKDVEEIEQTVKSKNQITSTKIQINRR